MDSSTRNNLLAELDALSPRLEERETGADEFHLGGMAYIHSRDFDTKQSRPWKLGWLEEDSEIERLTKRHK